MPQYHDLYADVYGSNFDRALKLQQQILESKRHDAELAETIRQHRANQIIQQARYLQAAQASQLRQQTSALSDIEANKTANMAVPPSAVAVGNGAAAANAARNQYFVGHPAERPGPLSPYAGGHVGLATYLNAAKPPTQRNIDPNSPEGQAARLEYLRKSVEINPKAPRNIDPNSPEGQAARLKYLKDSSAIKPPSQSIGGTAIANAELEGMARAHFDGLTPDDLKAPTTKWEYVDSGGGPTAPTPDGTVRGKTASGKVVTVPAKTFTAFDQKWNEVQQRKIALAQKQGARGTGGDPDAAAKAWLQANPNHPKAATVRALLGSGVPALDDPEDQTPLD